MDYKEFLKMKRGKLSQPQFAKVLGVRPEHYGRVERGQVKPSLTWLQEVVNKLNADVVIDIVPRTPLETSNQIELDLKNDKATNEEQ